MKYHKISKLLNDSTAPKFVARKWIEVNYLSSGQYSVNKNVRLKTPIIRYYLCDHIVQKRGNRPFSCCCK